MDGITLYSKTVEKAGADSGRLGFAVGNGGRMLIDNVSFGEGKQLSGIVTPIAEVKSPATILSGGTGAKENVNTNQTYSVTQLDAIKSHKVTFKYDSKKLQYVDAVAVVEGITVKNVSNQPGLLTVELEATKPLSGTHNLDDVMAYPFLYGHRSTAPTPTEG